MPIYEYGCEGCGHQLEVQQKLSDPPLRTCPQCGAEKLEKLISATAFVLKGTGWYRDGYGQKQKRTENTVTDRLEKAIKEDKQKTAAAGGSGSSDSGSGSSSSSSSDSSSKGDGGKSAGAHAA